MYISPLRRLTASFELSRDHAGSSSHGSVRVIRRGGPPVTCTLKMSPSLANAISRPFGDQAGASLKTSRTHPEPHGAVVARRSTLGSDPVADSRTRSPLRSTTSRRPSGDHEG